MIRDIDPRLIVQEQAHQVEALHRPAKAGSGTPAESVRDESGDVPAILDVSETPRIDEVRDAFDQQVAQPGLIRRGCGRHSPGDHVSSSRVPGWDGTGSRRSEIQDPLARPDQPRHAKTRAVDELGDRVLMQDFRRYSRIEAASGTRSSRRLSALERRRPKGRGHRPRRSAPAPASPSTRMDTARRYAYSRIVGMARTTRRVGDQRGPARQPQEDRGIAARPPPDQRDETEQAPGSARAGKTINIRTAPPGTPGRCSRSPHPAGEPVARSS